MTTGTQREDDVNEPPLPVERRRGNGSWSMGKEIIGTFFGVAPYVVAIVVWGASVNERLRVLELRIDHTEASLGRAETAAREQRQELLSSLSRITVQIEVLQQTVARFTK